MREPTAPTLDELIVEMRKISPPKVGGKTTKEWAEVWNINQGRARELVQHAILTKQMTTAPSYRPDITRPGRRVQVWLHAFVERKKK